MTPPLKDPDHTDANSSDTKLGKTVDLSLILQAQRLETWALLVESDLLDILGSGLGTPAKAAIVVAFPYDPRPASGPGPTDQPGGPQPYLRIAAFASSHRYTALTRLLKATARELAAITGYPYPDFRVAVNSRLPEKILAERAGLGVRGRSDLLLSHAYGPACILGLLLLPFELPAKLPSDLPSNVSADTSSQGARGSNRKSPCGSCQACADACPGQAIDGIPGGIHNGAACPGARENRLGLQGTYKREACIQHWMSSSEEPPADLRPAFEGHLYGCDACILACPLAVRAWLSDRSDGSSPASRAASLLLGKEQRPGTYISAPFLMHADDIEVKTFFRKTALGLSWLGPALLRRNASLGKPGI